MTLFVVMPDHTLLYTHTHIRTYLGIFPVQFLYVVCPNDSLLISLGHNFSPALIHLQIDAIRLERNWYTVNINNNKQTTTTTKQRDNKNIPGVKKVPTRVSDR